MAIKDKKLMHPNLLALCMLNEVLQPLNSKFIGCPAIVLTAIVQSCSMSSSYQADKWYWPAKMMNGGIVQPAALIPWITITHLELPG
jgi:hypothetical protein